MLRLFSAAALLLVSGLAFSGSAEECGKEASPCVRYGARVFQERCALCHGSDGLGEGILPLSMKKYPKTNLMDAPKAVGKVALRDIITYGGGLPNVSAEMPPWGDELTVTQLESTVLFVEFMRKDLEGALKLMREESGNLKPSIRVGRGVFKGRCALCHGAGGQGDGKMARVIKDPPPFNLTRSGAPDEYLEAIITKGGGAMGRSPRMPPWGKDLSVNEIKSVVLYIKTLRE